MSTYSFHEHGDQNPSFSVCRLSAGQMGSEGDNCLELSYFCNIKVHSLMCLELRNIIDRVSRINSGIESARPRCSTGLKALCSLHNAMDKAKQLIQHCSESSKLYLALTSNNILLRCEGIRNSLELCLAQIQYMVPTLLAAKISGIVEDVRGAKFDLEPCEKEAGSVIKTLLKKDIPASETANKEEYEALQSAAVNLKITSPLAVLIEKRSIKKLYDRIRDTDPKRKPLRYLLYLMRKYAEHIGKLHSKEDVADHQHKLYNTRTARAEPPVEFKCPISIRIMFDPVIIASGKTYERVWIQKWFLDGNDTCPVTQVRLENLQLTPNVSLKSLISKWSSDNGITVSEPSAQSSVDLVLLEKVSSFGSISSMGSSLNDLRLQVSNVSLQSSDTNPYYSDSIHVDSSFKSSQTNIVGRKSHLSASSHSLIRSISLTWLSKLDSDSMPWESRCKAVQHIKEQLQKTEEACDLVLDDNCMIKLTRFLKDAHDFGDVNAQNDSTDALLLFLNSNRFEMPPFNENVVYVLTSFLDSEMAEKALAILEVLSSQLNYTSSIVASGVLPSILKVLEVQSKELRERAMKILSNLSCNNDVADHIVYLSCISKLVPFLRDQYLAGYCLGIMNTLCNIEEGRRAMSGTNSCIALISGLVETGTELEQEAAMQILLSLCYEYKEQCLHIMQESIIRTLRDRSVNGNKRGQIVASELLQILGQKIDESDASGSCTSLSSGMSTNTLSGSSNQPKTKKSRFKRFGFLGRRISRFFLRKY